MSVSLSRSVSRRRSHWSHEGIGKLNCFVSVGHCVVRSMLAEVE